MGFHVCEYSHLKPSTFSLTSSGDTILHFSSGRTWEVPDMILHYIKDHNWAPPKEFVDDVINFEYLEGKRFQTKSIDQPRPVRIGYLSGPFETGQVPDNFLLMLVVILDLASENEYRTQYRGI